MKIHPRCYSQYTLRIEENLQSGSPSVEDWIYSDLLDPDLLQRFSLVRLFRQSAYVDNRTKDSFGVTKQIMEMKTLFTSYINFGKILPNEGDAFLKHHLKSSSLISVNTPEHLDRDAEMARLFLDSPSVQRWWLETSEDVLLREQLHSLFAIWKSCARTDTQGRKYITTMCLGKEYLKQYGFVEAYERKVRILRFPGEGPRFMKWVYGFRCIEFW